MALVRLAVVAAFLSLALLPGSAAARTTIFVDFDGHSDAGYPGCGVPIALPAFTGASASREVILRRLQEDFAPFDVTITSSDIWRSGHEPPGLGSFDPQQPAVRAVIGGRTGDICGVDRSGLSTDPLARNTVWIVEKRADGTRWPDAEIENVAAHELGHAFGALAAHAAPWTWLRLPAGVAHYLATLGPNDTNPLNQASHNLLALGKTEIMNGPRNLVRDIWWRDGNVAKALIAGGNEEDPADWVWSWQDDILSLAAALGQRSDDHPDSPQDGTRMRPFVGSLPSGETRVESSGIVEMNAASWPGMCPPVPVWLACPDAAEAEDPETPPAGREGDQGIVLAVSRDFFRFDITLNPPNGRVYVRVDTINGSSAGAYDANLDVDLEVWFKDPSTGWRDITALGVRRDVAADLWAEWTAPTSGTNGLRVGEFAVGVKSRGGYGDLGYYTVQVRGTGRAQVVAPPDCGSPRVTPCPGGNGIDLDSFVEMVRKLSTTGDLIRTVASLAENGTRIAVRVASTAPFDPSSVREPSKSAHQTVASATGQTSPFRVVSQIVDWESMSPEERSETSRRLAETLERFR